MLPDDADDFAALVRAAFAGLPVEPLPSALRLTGDDVRAHLAAGGGGVIVGRAQAGLLWAERDGGLYVSRLAVHAALRRRGVAVQLVMAALAEARRRGLPHAWLSTRLALAGNRRLFARCGFVEGAQTSHAGYVTPTTVDMIRRL